MYITHQFYDNFASWANSYVCTYKTLQEAKNEMYDSILTSISKTEKEDMEKIIKILKSRTNETCDNTSYYIVDNYWEDRYYFDIIDTDSKNLKRFILNFPYLLFSLQFLVLFRLSLRL